MQLLVVENEESQIKLVRDSVESFNKNNSHQIDLDIATSLEDGIRKLRSKYYDGAIVDLRLEQNDTVGLGNKILEEIKERLRFPVRVVSGHLGDLNPSLKEDNYLFKCHSRGDEDYETIFNEFVEIFNTGITSLLNNKGLIETNINTIFWKHISTILPEFIALKRRTPEFEIEKVLLRYISSHILEYLEISIDNNLEPFCNIEFYIKPPIKDKIFTGDIIKFVTEDRYGIILTPACDLATDTTRVAPKAEFVTIAYIYPFENVVDGKNSGDRRKLVSNSLDLKYHYLPQTVLFSGGFINFQNIVSVPITDIADQNKFIVECVITNPFRKDIISRFANYFSRQGQPSFS